MASSCAFAAPPGVGGVNGMNADADGYVSVPSAMVNGLLGAGYVHEPGSAAAQAMEAAPIRTDLWR